MTTPPPDCSCGGNNLCIVCQLAELNLTPAEALHRLEDVLLADRFAVDAAWGQARLEAVMDALNEPGTWGGEHPTRTPDAVCPFPNTGRSLSHGGEPANPGSLSASNVVRLDRWSRRVGT